MGFHSQAGSEMASHCHGNSEMGFHSQADSEMASHCHGNSEMGFHSQAGHLGKEPSQFCCFAQNPVKFP